MTPLTAAAASVVALAITALAGCSASGDDSPSVSWTQVALPGDAEAVTLTAYRDELVVGTRSVGDPPAPGLVRLTAGSAVSLPVEAASGYGREARWVSVAVDDTGALVAVGGARGGAHANVRWTVWQGSTQAGLTEQEQTFWTFGGWGAGDLVGAVAAPAGPVVVGSWGSAQVGLDAAVWLPEGSTWVRQDSAGTALESTPDTLVGPVAACADAASTLIAGSVVSLGQGSVRSLPAVWRSAGHAAQWSRLELPDSGASGEATGAVCGQQQGCTVVGAVDGRVAVWRLGDTVTRVPGVPDAPASDANPPTAPVLTADGVLIGVSAGADSTGASGAAAGTASDRAAGTAGSTVLREQDGRWTAYPGPPGPVRAIAVAGASVYAVAPDSSGVDRLWWRPL